MASEEAVGIVAARNTLALRFCRRTPEEFIILVPGFLFV
jgi:hypothetical protein